MRRLYFFSKLFLLLSFPLLTAGVVKAEVDWCKTEPIRFSGITWESAQFYTELARVVIEKGYGCKTTEITGSSTVVETALLLGDVDVWMELWHGRHAPIIKGEKAGDVKVIGEVLKGGTVEGWFVPSYVVKGDPKRGIKAVAPDLKSVYDLPKYKALFEDDEEPSKGRFLNCPPGWECEKINNQKIKAYKLTEHYTNFHPGSGGALDAAIVSAIKRGKPVLFYYWDPSALMGKYDLFQLEEPPYNEKCWNEGIYMKTIDNPCPSATPSTRLKIAVRTELYNRSPEIIDFFSKISFGIKELDRIIVRITDEKLTPRKVAEQYIKDNPDVIKAWVSKDVGNKIYGM